MLRFYHQKSALGPRRTPARLRQLDEADRNAVQKATRRPGGLRLQRGGASVVSVWTFFPRPSAFYLSIIVTSVIGLKRCLLHIIPTSSVSVQAQAFVSTEDFFVLEKLGKPLSLFFLLLLV